MSLSLLDWVSLAIAALFILSITFFFAAAAIGSHKNIAAFFRIEGDAKSKLKRCMWLLICAVWLVFIIINLTDVWDYVSKNTNALMAIVFLALFVVYITYANRRAIQREKERNAILINEIERLKHLEKDV